MSEGPLTGIWFWNLARRLRLQNCFAASVINLNAINNVKLKQEAKDSFGEYISPVPCMQVDIDQLIWVLQRAG